MCFLESRWELAISPWHALFFMISQTLEMESEKLQINSTQIYASRPRLIIFLPSWHMTQSSSDSYLSNFLHKIRAELLVSVGLDTCLYLAALRVKPITPLWVLRLSTNPFSCTHSARLAHSQISASISSSDRSFPTAVITHPPADRAQCSHSASNRGFMWCLCQNVKV